MHEWEVWANQQMDKVDEGEVDEDIADEAIELKFNDICKDYTSNPDSHSVQFENPPDYDPSEKIVNFEQKNNTATVLTQQIHKKKLSTNSKDPNCQVTYELILRNGQWLIDKRLKKDSDGDIFDIGI